MTNKASEDELDTILTLLETSVSIDTSRRMVGARQSESPKTTHARAKVAIQAIIRTEKLKLLVAVRERVVGERTSPNFDNEYGYCINCEFQPTDGTKHCLCYYDEKLRKKQRTALNKLEAEL